MQGKRKLRFAALSTCIVLTVLAGCSGKTMVRLSIDILSFFSSDERVVEFFLPPLGVYNFYLLPGLQIDKTEEGPDEVHRGGMVFDLPTTPDTPPLYGITVNISGEITIRNLNPTGTLQLVRLSVIIASENTRNIYTDGAVIASLPVDPIEPGESDMAQFDIEISEDSPILDILDTSSMRLGLKLTYPETTGEEMKAGFEITRLEFSAGGLPFRLIPGVN